MREESAREGRYRSRDGLQLFYRDYPALAPGDRDPLICLPGLTRNSLDFQALAQRLQQRCRVITPDLRGRGRSDHDPDRSHYRPTQYASDIFDLMAELDMDRAAILGTSLGGLVAMVMHRQRPDAVSRVVLNDVGPEIDPAGLARVMASAGLLPAVPDWPAAAARCRELYGPAYPGWTDQRWLQFARISYREVPGKGLDLQLDRNVGVAVREGLSGLDEDPWELFDALGSTPVLVLRGSLSDILTPDILARMRARKPDLEVVIVPCRGHAPFLDEKESVDAIESFLFAR